jgi:transcriptional regulator with XRE-family HTH domain
MKIDLGARLKIYRRQKGLTMRELAKLARCSPSFISQLELNQVSPTLTNLEKICHALQMSLVEMLREEPHLDEPIQVPLHSDDHPMAMCWHRARMRHLFPANAPKPFTALQLTLDVGGETPLRSSRRPINELAIVLSGRVEVIIDDKVYVLEPLTAIYFDLGRPHQWRNLGDTVAEILMIHPYVFQLFEQAEEDLIWSRRKEGPRLFKAS